MADPDANASPLISCWSAGPRPPLGVKGCGVVHFFVDGELVPGLLSIRVQQNSLGQSRGVKMPSLDQVIVWIIVGLLGGSLAALIITRERKGFGIARNLAVGLIGALVGGLLFRVLGIFPGLAKVAISLRDIVAAVIGSLLVLAALWLWQRRTGSS